MSLCSVFWKLQLSGGVGELITDAHLSLVIGSPAGAYKGLAADHALADC